MKIKFKNAALVGLFMFVCSLFNVAKAGLITSDANEYFISLADLGIPPTLTLTSSDMWQIGYGDSSVFTQFTGVNLDANSVFTTGLPGAFINTSASTLNYLGFAIPAGEIWMHPGDANNLSTILRFIAPQASDYNFDALFKAIDSSQSRSSGSGDIAISILRNNIHLDGQIIDKTPDTQPPQPDSFNYIDSLALQENDVVSFIIGRAGDFYFDDSTLLKVTVTYDDGILDEEDVEVSEPSTLTIFALGMIGLASRRFKKQS